MTANIRSDVQALRAFAVTSVVLFHAEVPGFSGGYYGVDVFFVISGFLITQLLCRERAATNTIDLLAFWTRRAWRLLPNALTVLLVCLLLAVVVGPVLQRQSVAVDIASALAYVGNYRFLWRSLDYFDDGGMASPVLHFWSLGVEEQFYLIWPLLFAWVGSRKAATRNTLAALAAVVIGISLALMVYWSNLSQPHVFFSVETRMWELAAGALLAIYLQSHRLLDGLGRDAAMLVGSAGLIATVAGAHRLTPSPEFFSVVPVLATVLVLISGAGNTGIPGRIASIPPVQWVGDRSYSIYLWHWPILIYGAYVFGDSAATQAMLIAVILVVSAAAYRWIETPLRIGHRASIIHGRQLRWLVLPTASIALATVALMLSPSLQLGDRASVAERLIAAKADVLDFKRPDCAKGWRSDPNNTCAFGDRRPGRPIVYLVGDSYAEHLVPGVDKAAANAGWTLMILTRGACPPLRGISIGSRQSGVANTACLGWLDAVLARMSRDKPDLILISTAGVIAAPLLDSSGQALDKSSASQQWQRGFIDFLTHLKGAGAATVVLLGTPRGRYHDYETCVSNATGNQCGLPRLKAVDRSELIVAAARQVDGIEILDLANRFCSPNVCHSVIDGLMVYRDAGHHLTATFASSLSPSFEKVLRSHAQPKQGMP